MLQTTPKTASLLILLLRLWTSLLLISASYERDPVNDLIEHAISNGAVISPKLVFRGEDDGDIANGTNTVSIDRKPAVVARNDVARGEILVSVPSELCLRASDDDEDDGEGYEPYCRILRTLVDDMYDDSNSKSPPHARYLASLPRDVNPALWSNGAINLLNEMVGTRLPPFDLEPYRENLDGFFESSSCWDAFPELFDDDEDEEERHQIEELLWHARHVGFTRTESEGGDLVGIPVVDMMTHRNGRWRNAEFVNNAYDEEEGTLYDGGTYDIVARRDIKAGERIYISFELSTVEMLEQHGVIESYPQSWDIGNGVAFDIDEATGEDSNDGEGELIVKFRQRPTTISNSFLREEIMRLRDFKKAAPAKKANIPSSEWDMLWAYYDALNVALTQAHDSAVDIVGGDKLTVMADVEENQTDKEKGGCDEGDESCPSALGSHPPKLSLSDKAAELIKHVTTHGAVVSPKLLFRDEDETESKNGLMTVSIDRKPAIIAREDIKRGEVIVSVPTDLVLRARDDVDGQPYCRILRTLIDEMSAASDVDDLDLGGSPPSSSSHSSSYPHARYLASLPRDVNPSLWSDGAIDLLKEMLGTRLPPFDLQPFRGDLDGFLEQAWCEDTFPELTGPGGDRFEELLWHARHLTMTRNELEGDDLVGIPVIDMMTHRNGRWRNAYFVNNNAYDDEEGTVMDGGAYEIVAHRDIRAGERVYISFDVSTVELFSHYGVVESYPQSWDIGNGVAFDIDEAEEEGEEGRLVVKFRQRPSKRSKAFIRGELVRLKHFKRGAQQVGNIPLKEWDMIWAYHDALVAALTHAHNAAVDAIGGDKLTSQS